MHDRKIHKILSYWYMQFIWYLFIESTVPTTTQLLCMWKDRGKRLYKARQEWTSIYGRCSLCIHVFWILLRDTQRRPPNKIRSCAITLDPRRDGSAGFNSFGCSATAGAYYFFTVNPNETRTNVKNVYDDEIYYT